METVYQHFRPSERAFIDTATGWVTSAENQYSPYLTPFIDPRQAYILKTLVAQTPDFLLEVGPLNNCCNSAAQLSPVKLLTLSTVGMLLT